MSVISASVSLKNAVSSSPKLLTQLSQLHISYARGEGTNEESCCLLFVRMLLIVWHGGGFRQCAVNFKGYVSIVSCSLFRKAREAICLCCLWALSVQHIRLCRLAAREYLCTGWGYGATSRLSRVGRPCQHFRTNQARFQPFPKLNCLLYSSIKADFFFSQF